jgi:hypothetical protein
VFQTNPTFSFYVCQLSSWHLADIHITTITEQILNERLLCVCCGNAAVNKLDKNLCVHGADVLVTIVWQ